MRTEERAARLDAIYRAIPGLMALRSEIWDQVGRQPCGVVLISDLDPSDYEDGVTTDAPTLMGMPITWGDRVGLIYEAP